VLVMPNASYVALMLNDVMGFTEAAYRTYRGQVPSIDFWSTYGAAIYYPAALGFYFNFNLGSILGFGHFVTAVPLLTMAVVACYRRFPILPSVIFLVFLFFLILVPMSPGGNFSDLTYGLFYNRHGWAVLSIALLFYIEPRSTGRSDLLLDTIILSLLLLYLFYVKVTFAFVALAFVAVNAITSRYKMWLSLASLSIFIAVVAAISVFTAYNSAYFNDFLGTISRTPVFQHTFSDTYDAFHRHQAFFLLCFLSLGAVYLTGHRKFFDLAFVTGCIITSLWLLDQSGSTERGLPALIAVFMILGELARRKERQNDALAAPSSRPRNVAALCVLCMLLAFVSEPMELGARALYLHFNKVTGQQSVATMPESGIYVATLALPGLHEAMGHDDRAHADFNQQRSWDWWQDLKPWEYLPLMSEGVKLLESVPHDNHSVITFEHTNPFSVLLRMRPTKYGYPLFWAQNALAENLPAPQRYFSDADYVMVPEIPYSRLQLKMLMQVYGTYLEENFYVLKRSSHWRLYARSQ
jgi:hypothetical protein